MNNATRTTDSLTYVLRTFGSALVQGTSYTREDTVLRTDASSYYVLRGHKLLVPNTPTAFDSIQSYASATADWSIPDVLSGIPSASREVAEILLEDAGYSVLPVLTKELVAKPIHTLSPMEEEAYREQKKRTAIAAKVYHPTSNDFTL